MKKIQLSCFLYLITLVCAFSQSLENEVLSKLKKYYATKDNYSCVMELKVYTQHKEGEILQSENSKVSISGFNKRMKVGAIEIITNDNYTFQIDHQEKEFAVLKTKTTRPEGNKLSSDPTALLVNDAPVKKISQYSSIVTYEMTIGSSELEKMDITFDTSNFTIKKVILYYPTESQEYRMHYKEDGTLEKIPTKKKLNNYRMEITYLEIKEEAFSATYFTYDDFIIKNNNKYYPKTDYKNYKYNN